MALSLGEKNKTYAGERGFDTNPLLDSPENFTISYEVIADNCEEELDGILNATNPNDSTKDIPKYRTNRGDGWLVRKYARELQSGANHWQVDCFYEQHVDVNSRSAEYGAKRIFDYRWGAESVMEVITKDALDGRDIANAVGEPFTLEAPIAIPVLTVEKIYLYFDHLTILKYLNKTNSSDFWGSPPGTVLCADIRDEPIEQSGFLHRKVSFVFKFNQKKNVGEQGETIIGWATQLRNRGTFYYKRLAIGQGTTGSTIPGLERIKFRDKFKDVLTGDLEFDGTKRLENSDGETLPPLYYTFNRFKRENFNNLQLTVQSP